MKFLGKVVNFFGGLIALVLSLALILVLVAVPAMFAAQMTMEPETLQQILVGVVETTITQTATGLQQDEDETQTAKQNMVKHLMESQAAKDLLELYVEDFFGQMRGETGKFRADTLEQLAKEHMDELLPVVRQLAEQKGVDTDKLSDRHLEAQLMEIVEEYGSKLMDNLPTPEQLGIEPMPEVAEGSVIVVDAELIQRVMNKDFRRADLATLLTQMVMLLENYWGLKFLGLVAAALSLAILLCRMGKGFGCFSWLAVDYIIGGVLALTTGTTIITGLQGMGSGPGSLAVSSLLSPVMVWFLVAGGGIFVLGILFGVISAKGESWFTKGRK